MCHKKYRQKLSKQFPASVMLLLVNTWFLIRKIRDFKIEMSMKSIKGFNLSTTKTMHNCHFHTNIGKKCRWQQNVRGAQNELISLPSGRNAFLLKISSSKNGQCLLVIQYTQLTQHDTSSYMHTNTACIHIMSESSWLNLHLPMQSMHITTNFVSSNPIHN